MPDGMGAPPSNKISPNDFLGYLVEMRAAEREKDKGVAKLRNIRKQMEAKGTNLKALDLFLKMQRDEDEGEIILREAFQMMRWANLKIGQQASLFVDGVDMPSEQARGELVEAQAYNEGHAAGKAGRSITSSGKPPGTPVHQRWAQGWHDGQAELAEIFCLPPAENGEALKPPKAEKAKKPGSTLVTGRPRGRPRKNAEAAA